MFSMIQQIEIDSSDAVFILDQDEGHFLDVTSKEVDGKTIQVKCSAFANADGGELLVGIIDKKESKLTGILFERWNGFKNQEEANGILQALSEIAPTIDNINYEFLVIKGNEDRGIVLKINIEKSTQVHETSSHSVYIRKGAQCLRIFGEQILNLKLSKGVNSYENQIINDYDIDRLKNSTELLSFLSDYSPKTEPLSFLKKQNLISKEDNLIYCAILMYDENPSAVLPKKCSVKIVRYDTTDAVPERRHLKEQFTIEGSVNLQIKKSLDLVKKIIESVSIMGPAGLEKSKYPIDAIKEVLVNAIIHRDYNISDDVIVFIFNNRIEIHSPGILPGNVKIENILDERFSRNPKIVRLLHKYPDAPNKDIGEGLNTAFQKMKEVRLKEPVIRIGDNKVVVILPHELLASPEEQIMEYLGKNGQITNKIAREITGEHSENKVKKFFYNLQEKGLIELEPKSSKSFWILSRSNQSAIDKRPNEGGRLF